MFPVHRPQGGSPAAPGSHGSSEPNFTSTALAPHSCQTCARRKVKCDKTQPVCSSCRKSKLDCDYRKSSIGKRKRRLSDAVKKLARYEQILLDHGLLATAKDATSSTHLRSAQGAQAPSLDQQSRAHPGRLIADQRYIDKNNLAWPNFEDHELQDDETQPMTDDGDDDDDEEDAQQAAGKTKSPAPDYLIGGRAADPLIESWMSVEQERPLLDQHPTANQAMLLWKAYVANVEPICRILHVPTTSAMLASGSKQPTSYSKANECLVFAIYHFAVFSMTDEQCTATFGEAASRIALIQRFHVATRQALTNTSYLKSTELEVLQSLVILLIPCRFLFDPNVYWIWTGVAMRLGQRMGLHRDGEYLGLPPFDAEIRRRLFWQLIPLDGVASTMAGAGVPPIPESWDTRKPLNVNDDDFWPGMLEQPQEQRGATEMIYCLTRFCVGSAFVKIGKMMPGTQDYRDIEPLIRETEIEVEDSYLRYCDFVNPLHVMTMCLARSAITAFRLRTRLLRVKADRATDAEKDELLRLSFKILDTDITASTNTGLQKFSWHMRRFFIWGSWDSLIFVLRSLRSGALSSTDTDEAWSRIERVYSTRDLLDTKQGLHVAVGRLTMDAWSKIAPTVSQPGVEPAFIKALRKARKTRAKPQDQSKPIQLTPTLIEPLNSPPAAPLDPMIDDHPTDIGLQYDHDVNLDSVDWAFWDQLIEEYQAQGGP
nr:transcription factor vrtr1 [Quercus suber]